jgi:hypothetical protein
MFINRRLADAFTIGDYTSLWLINAAPFFVLYQKSTVESVTQEGTAIWAAITNIENASETTMTTPTPLLTSSGSCL